MKTFTFGQYTCPFSQVFFTTAHTLGFVNLKPIVPGHVLLIPKRVCKRFHELTKEEVSDLYQSAQLVGKVLEKEYNAKALTISMQDGIDAGQSVYHVHVHILPRKPGDFKRNDDIYDKINETEAKMAKDYDKNQTAGVDAEEDRPPRTAEEMDAEAKQLRCLFEQYDKDF